MQKQELKTLLTSLKPGASVVLAGYKTKDGAVKDIQVRLLGPGGYADLKRETVAELRELAKNTPLDEHERTAVEELVKSMDGVDDHDGSPSPSSPLSKGNLTGNFLEREDKCYLVNLRREKEEVITSGKHRSVSKDPVKAAKKIIRDDMPIGAYILMLDLDQADDVIPVLPFP